MGNKRQYPKSGNNELLDAIVQMSMPKQVTKSPQKAMKSAKNEEVMCGWDSFVKFAQEYNDNVVDRGITVWIDGNLKNALDKIKNSGACDIPIRHLASAAIRVFIEQNREDIESALKMCRKYSKKNVL